MKKILVFIILLAISLSVNAQSYDKLWNEYNENIENLLPESAGKVLDKIEKKALKEKNEVQILKMLAARCELFTMSAEFPRDTIKNYCKAYLPKLSKTSQVFVNIELAKYSHNYETVLKYIDDDFIKTVSMKDYAILFENEDDDYDLEFEPTLYDYVLNSIIKNCYSCEDRDKLYQYLLDYDLENGYIKAYYNNRINRLGQTVLDADGFNELEQLAKECPDNELVAKIRVYQIIYLSTTDWGRKPDYILAKQYCDEVMNLVDTEHQYYKFVIEALQHIEQKTIRVKVQNAYVPNTYIPVGLTYRNTTNPSYKIFKVSAKEFERLVQMYDKEFLNALFANKIAIENTISLPEETDYNEHSTLIALPPLDKGFYYTVFSTTNSFDNLDDMVFMGFQVTNLSYFYTESEYKVTMHVVDRETGFPKKGVTAEFSKQIYDYPAKYHIFENIGSAVSDKKGLIVAILDWDYNTYVKLYHDGDTMLSIQPDRFYSEKSNEKPVIKTNFYTDRAIYRPGQTVQFKGIVYQQTGNKQELLTDYKTTVYMYDANYQLIDSLQLICDEFGSISGNFIIPNDVLNGRFSIRNDYGSLNFAVEEYKRPTFEVTFNTPEKEYKIGDSVTVTGKVMALSGFGLDNVKYSYTVSRHYKFPWRRTGWGAITSKLDKTIATGEGVTANDGSFAIDFQLLPNDNIEKYELPFYTYLIEVKATNAQGESQKESFSVFAAYNKYSISLTNDKESINIADLKNLDVTVTNIAGKPVNTNIEYKIFKFKDLERFEKYLEEFDRQILSDEQLAEYFPNFDYYADKHISKELVYQGVINVDGNAKLLPEDLKLNPAQYLIELQSVDDTLSSISKGYLVYNPKSKKLPCKSMCWTRVDKTTAHKGETVNFYVGSSLENASAIIVASSGDKILKMKRVKLNNSIYKFSYKIKDLDLDYIIFKVKIVKHNHEISSSKRVEIPFDYKKLNITLNTERNKILPGETETWSVTIKDYKNKPVVASLMAGMYDASLDKFTAQRWYANNSWDFNNIPVIYYRSGLKHADYTFMTKSNSSKEIYFSSYYYWDYFKQRTYSDSSLLPYLEVRAGSAAILDALSTADYEVEEYEIAEEAVYYKAESNQRSLDSDSETGEKLDVPPAKIRKNFNETAFFYPDLRTDKNGNATFSFTMPDALTRWKLRMLAYDKDLKVGNLEKEFVTQQPLMIMADMPRFVYDEDTLWIAANVINLSDETLSPTAKLEIFDENNNPIELILSDHNINISEIPAGRSQSVRWKVAMQKDVNPLTFRFSAITDGFSDAEQHLLPVLSTNVEVVETMATVFKTDSTAMTMNYMYEPITMNFTTNPTWQAVQALPYIQEGDEKCATSAFYRYFINAMSHYIVQTNPKIQEMFENANDYNNLSELQKHEELKAILLQKTPWVFEAKSEAEQRANVAKLFDTEAINKNLESSLDLMTKKQTVNGGWAWMDGMPESEYITQYILEGLGKLDICISNTGEKQAEISEKAFHFIENEVVKKYEKLDSEKKRNDYHCDYMLVKDLLAMSYFPSYNTSEKYEEAKVFFLEKLSKDWKTFNFFNFDERACIALIFNRNGMKDMANLLLQSLRECRSPQKLYPDSEMCWPVYRRTITVKEESQILLAFNEIDPVMEEIDAMRRWLLKQKRTTKWDNEIGTVEAIYALMNTGNTFIDDNDSITLTINGKTIDLDNRPFVQINLTSPETDYPDGKIEIIVDNQSNHEVWGGFFTKEYWPIDIMQKTSANMMQNYDKDLNMKIKREIIVPENIKVGDKVTVKITFENSQDMEFVYLKDLRGACFEPTEQLSRYHWDNGLWYYQSTTDVSMEYFFESLPKGKHTVSYEVYVTKDGSFSAGYSYIQCQYAPEFSAYSNGERISVNP